VDKEARHEIEPVLMLGQLRWFFFGIREHGKDRGNPYQYWQLAAYEAGRDLANWVLRCK
jgi:hypothetical protein